MSQQRGEYTAQRLISLKRHHPRVRQPSAAMSCKQCGACMARLGRPQRVRAHATAAQSPGVRLHIAPGVRSRGSSWRAPRATGPECLRCAACRGCSGVGQQLHGRRARAQGPPSTLRTRLGAWSPPAARALRCGCPKGAGSRRIPSSFYLILARGGSREESPAVFYLILFGL